MTFDEQLQHALDSFTGRLREEVGRQVRAVGNELAEEARAEQAAADRAPGHARLAAGVRVIGGALSLAEVLDTLVASAAHEASRAAILLANGERLHAWREVSFDGRQPIDIARGDASSIAAAVQTGEVTSSALGADAAPGFAQLPPGQAWVAVPIAIGGQVVAVLYADGGVDGHVDADAVEILTRHAAQRLEALTAMKAARSLAAKSDAQQPAAATPGSPGSAGSGASDAEPVDDHAAARRYARLLVSEIKLYHEPAVVEGRRERDLATRLGGEIARVRTLYEQRVPLAVRQNTDYVHEELIRTLADGDASLLDARS